MATRPVEDQDRRRSRGVPLSDREVAAIAVARGEIPLGQWGREAMLEKLAREGIDVADEARRSAPRRRNYSQRAVKETGQ